MKTETPETMAGSPIELLDGWERQAGAVLADAPADALAAAEQLDTFERHSPEWFAVHVLFCVHATRRNRADGNLDDALFTMARAQELVSTALAQGKWEGNS